MKKITLVLAGTMTMLLTGAQNDTILPPYKKFPTLPPAKLLLTDSITYFTKDDIKTKNPVLYMLFNPDCEHCKKKAEEFNAYREKLKNVFIVMSTTAPFEQMLDFYIKYNLQDFPNIVVGRDYQYFLPTFYQIRSMPFLAFYNKKKELISVIEGAPPLEKMLEELKK
jgi:thiol-disulfide isomerase/thioredoxin